MTILKETIKRPHAEEHGWNLWVSGSDISDTYKSIMSPQQADELKELIGRAKRLKTVDVDDMRF